MKVQYSPTDLLLLRIEHFVNVTKPLPLCKYIDCICVALYLFWNKSHVLQIQEMQKTIWASLTHSSQIWQTVLHIVYLFQGIYCTILIPQKNTQGNSVFFSMSVQNFITVVFLNDLFYPSLSFSPLNFQSLTKKPSAIKVFGVRSLRLETDEKWILNTLYSFGLGGNVITFVLDDCI